eukprot:12373676-Alexandrium_andersonii.AAC.1
MRRAKARAEVPEFWTARLSLLQDYAVREAVRRPSRKRHVASPNFAWELFNRRGRGQIKNPRPRAALRRLVASPCRATTG